MKAYILGHWRGEHSLARSILVNSWLVNLVFGAADMIVASRIPEDANNATLAAHIAIIIAYKSIVVTWQLVGVWRSTTRAISERGHDFGLIVARLYVAIVAAITVYHLTDLILVNSRLVEVMFGLDREISEFEIETLSDTEIALNGGISDSAAAVLEYELQTNEKIRILHLTSIGGYVSSAKLFVGLIQKYELETYVSWECLSACTNVFIAANTRSIGLEGYLGYHSADCPGLILANEACAELNAETENYYSERGVARWFVKKISATSSNDMWEPTFKELSDAGIITHIFDGETDVKAKEYCRINDCTMLPVFEFAEEEVLSP